MKQSMNKRPLTEKIWNAHESANEIAFVLLECMKEIRNAYSFQRRAGNWVSTALGDECANSRKERNHRFLEEALELVQSLECTRAEAHMLVDYVFDRPTGETPQELGGVVITLAALANAANLSAADCGEAELTRCWGNIDKIREKQKGKPR